MDQEQPGYFCVIPAEVRYDKSLSASEKLFYGEITALAKKDGRCWARRQYFAELYGVEERTISRWTSKLAERGYIQVRVLRNGNNEILRRNILLTSFPHPRDKNVTPLGQKCPYPSDKNVADNNTSKNNKKVSKKTESYDDILENIGEELRESLLELIKARKLLKKPLTNKALQLIIAKLDKLANSEAEKIAIVNQSIENGWAGVFPLKEQGSNTTRNPYQPAPTNVYKPYGMPAGFGLSSWVAEPAEVD